MRAGLLRHRLALQSATKTADSYGQMQETWSTDAYVKGHVRPLSGQELMNAQQVQENVSHSIRIRHQAGVTSKHRVLWGARAFAVLTVLNREERDIELELMCMEQPE